MAKFKCKICGKTKDSNTTWQKFCSNACRQKNKRKKSAITDAQHKRG